MFFARRAGDRIVDRGDVGGYDVLMAALTLDNEWHNLDLSSILPTNAKWVRLRAQANSMTAPESLMFRRKGNTNNINVDGVFIAVESTDTNAWPLIKVGNDGIIEYCGTVGTWYSIYITVIQWIL